MNPPFRKMSVVAVLGAIAAVSAAVSLEAKEEGSKKAAAKPGNAPRVDEVIFNAGRTVFFFVGKTVVQK